MADYGIEIKNSSGNVIIDSIYKNYSKYDDGAVVDNDHDYTLTFTPYLESGAVPIIALTVDTEYFIGAPHLIYNQYPGKSYGYAYGYSEYDSGSAWTIDNDFIIFKEGQSASNENYGLIIKNSDEETVFTSWDRWLKIISINTFTLNSSNDWESALPYLDRTVSNADNNYFILIPTSNNRWFAASPIGEDEWMLWYTYLGMKKINSTIVRVGQYLHYLTTTGLENFDSNNWDSDIILLEVNI